MKRLLTAVIILMSMMDVSLAAIVNGSFENGLEGVVKQSGAGELAALSSIGSITPTDGNHLFYMSTGPGDIGGDGLGEFTYATMRLTIEQEIKTLSMDINVITGQSTPSNWFDDHVQVDFPGAYLFYATTRENTLYYRNDATRFNNQIYKHNAFSLMNPALSPNGSYYTQQTGWQHVVVDVSELAGLGLNFDFRFLAIEETNSQLFDTALLIDNIRLESRNPVPIPGAVWLLGSGLMGLGLFRRMKNRLCK